MATRRWNRNGLSQLEAGSYIESSAQDHALWSWH